MNEMEDRWYGDGGSKESPNYGDRTDGTKKGEGFFGKIKRPDGKVSTELSIGFEMDGKEVLMPAMVPTLSKKELDHLISGGEITKEIADKAYKHGMKRIKSNKSTFIEAGEKPTPIPKG
tara:strand:+ start:422 stop:778 length:357 start_codon:yes stop_codon:yes gene_type:complete